MMRNKKWLLALALCACAALTGCQFAKEDTLNKAQDSDSYVGVCLRLINWGEPDGYDEYGNPYYNGEDEQVELTDAQTQALIEGKPIEFDTPELPISDRYFYTRTMKDEQGNEYVGLEQANWPGAIKNHISVSDTEDKHESDAEVYVTGSEFRYDSADKNTVELRIDDIFERTDGTIYAKQSGGIFGYVDGYTRETKSSTSVKDENGALKTFTVRCKVTINYVNELETATIIAFSADGALIARTEINWRVAQERIEYDIPADAAYLVLEQTSINIENTRETERTLKNLPFTEDMPLFTIFVPDDVGFANPIGIYAAK